MSVPPGETNAPRQRTGFVLPGDLRTLPDVLTDRLAIRFLYRSRSTYAFSSAQEFGYTVEVSVVFINLLTSWTTLQPGLGRFYSEASLENGHHPYLRRYPYSH